MGPTLLQRVGVAIDPDEMGTGCGVEDAERVPGSSEGGVDEDPSWGDCGEEKIDDRVGEDGAVRWRAAGDLPPCAIRIDSPHDPEARYGTKRATRWTGYKVHLTETCGLDPNARTAETWGVSPGGGVRDGQVDAPTV